MTNIVLASSFTINLLLLVPKIYVNIVEYINKYEEQRDDMV